MIDSLLRIATKSLLDLRYRVRVRGLEAVAQRGTRGILFLPNHPAIIDPVIIVAALHRRFRPRALADKDQIEGFLIRWFTRKFNVLPVPDMSTHGPGARGQVAAAVQQCADALKRGDNLVLYPSGHLYRSRLENLHGNSAVESILQRLPDVRIVLIRTTGLWGSSFSFAASEYPNLLRGTRAKLGALLKNLILFSPRREVSLELHEPHDLPRTADRNELNAWLEEFYNRDAPPNTYVPYTIWERGGRRTLPEPDTEAGGPERVDVPESTRRLVHDHLREITDGETLRDQDRLAQDLGLDSLARAELVIWLGSEFGFHVGDVASLKTVADVLLAACGESTATRAVELKPLARAWFAPVGPHRLTLPPGQTIPDVFLKQARLSAGRVAIADQLSGAKTYRDLITAILVLKPMIEALPGERIGIMLPASVAAATTYLAALFAGKTPVLVNWTTGSRNIAHSLDLTDTQRILSVRPLVARIESQGTDLEAVKERFVYLEDFRKQISIGVKLRAWLRSRVSWAPLRKARISETAAVLLTSGSEALPKAVPLTHANILTNIGDVLKIVTMRQNDSMIGFLPPFHSFGLSVTMAMPLLAGLRVVYHSNPTESWILARLIEAYKASIVVGTPTFLSGIVRAARPGQLATLRMAVTGAEKCPQRTYEALADACPGVVVLEGYGITECSPIVAANREEDPRPGTIGKILPSLEYVLVDLDSWQRVGPAQTGMLLVRGPSVFPGYIGNEAASPFVEFDGRTWYRTGDLISEDADGVLTFRGRLKRFVKMGGEMISLPAIEGVLDEHFSSDDEEGPTIAVEATPSDEHPEIVLFTTRQTDRKTVNGYIRQALLSPLHNVSRVVQVEEIPVLGTGKTDYRALRDGLRRAAE